MEFALYLYLGKCMICQHWKDEYIWFNHLRMDFVNLFDYLEPLKMIYLGVLYLGNLKKKNLINKKWIWTLWQFCLRDGYYVFVNVFYQIIWKYTKVMSSSCFFQVSKTIANIFGWYYSKSQRLLQMFLDDILP